ncbi:MAG: hypothetical protein ACLTZT_13925 [Butyricimonas faecalis]
MDVLDRAADVFARLNMHKTAQRNGVLIYVALLDHKSAILGDAGINAKVPRLLGFDHEKHDREIQGRQDHGRHLRGRHHRRRTTESVLPYQADDVNELPDEISFQ